MIDARGQMGAADAKTVKAEEPKHPNGEHIKKPKKTQEFTVEAEKENAGGCCQGANGFSCCKDASLENNTTSEENKEVVSKFSCWSSKLEQHNVLTAIAIVGAVATVTVAYAYYRKSHWDVLDHGLFVLVGIYIPSINNPLWTMSAGEGAEGYNLQPMLVLILVWDDDGCPHFVWAAQTAVTG